MFVNHSATAFCQHLWFIVHLECQCPLDAFLPVTCFLVHNAIIYIMAQIVTSSCKTKIYTS